MNYFHSCEILLAAGLSRLQGGWDFNIFPPTQILDDFKNLQCYLGNGHVALQFPQPFYTEPTISATVLHEPGVGFSFFFHLN